jgi:hypothetical protein
MKKIYFASNWGQTSKEMSNFYNRQTINNSGVWNDIKVTLNINESDYVIVLDNTEEPIPKDKKIIFLGREPNHILSRDNSLKFKDCYNFLHHEFNNCWLAQTWWVDMGYETIDDTPPLKTKTLTVIDSGKDMVKGHKDRSNIINKLILKYPNDIDVYGKITQGKENKKPFKTFLPNKNKISGLIDYKYSLVIENGSTDYYFSEKISDSIMCWTMPIYWGCKKIDRFLPKGSYINFDINESNVEDKIIEISKSSYAEDNIDNLIKARKLIMNKYNIWPTIEMAIKKEKFI